MSKKPIFNMHCIFIITIEMYCLSVKRSTNDNRCPLIDFEQQNRTANVCSLILQFAVNRI